MLFTHHPQHKRQKRRAIVPNTITGDKMITKTPEYQKSRVLRGTDIISEEIYDIVEGPDRKGNYLLTCGQRTVLVNPSRMLTINEGAPAVYRTPTELKVACPGCSSPITVEIGSNTAECVCDDSDGEFTIDWSKIESCVRPAPPEEKAKTRIKKKPTKSKASGQRQTSKSRGSMKIDFDELKRVGELWTKAGVKFDYVDYVVDSHAVLIFGQKPRKFFFNSYNGTWGKKSGDDKLQAFIDNVPRVGKSDWHQSTKAPEQERKKLERQGYIRIQ